MHVQMRATSLCFLLMLSSLGCSSAPVIKTGINKPLDPDKSRWSQAFWFQTGAPPLLFKDAVCFVQKGVDDFKAEAIQDKPGEWALRWKSDAGPKRMSIVFSDDRFRSFHLYDGSFKAEYKWNKAGLGRSCGIFNGRTVQGGGMDLMLLKNGKWQLLTPKFFIEEAPDFSHRAIPSRKGS